ncbi:hypothetical protein TSUD_277760 [Trifolium subterraneum]|uniref:GST C-terminal domain-containing protein n=1 Tax=Trifolium subterraneum TaxID=3900 RepID=A0A2Z6MHR9_TRISU|nr:hypothetical protein TSUD_277760 [Trifolium subterraneum]
MALTLYSSPEHKNVSIALITAEYSLKPVKLVPCTNESSEIGKILPMGEWIDFASTHLEAVFSFLYKSRCGATHIDDEDGVRPEECTHLEKSLLVLNTHLSINSYLVGDYVTLADIITTCDLSFGFTMLLEKKYTSKFPHVERYFWYMVKLPKFKKILGDVKQIEVWTRLTIMPSKPKKFKPAEEVVEPSQPKIYKPAEVVEPSQPKIYKPAEVVEPSQPKKFKPAEEVEPSQPKIYKPAEVVEPSNKTTLDEWKTLYSDYCESRITTIKEKYSLWFCNYKYNDENTDSSEAWKKVCGSVQKMVCNYAFGRMFLIGSQPPFKVKGLWLFHGQEISRLIIDDYEWKKVDISDKAQEMLVNQIIEGIQLFEGEPVLYDKFFN